MKHLEGSLEGRLGEILVQARMNPGELDKESLDNQVIAQIKDLMLEIVGFNEPIFNPKTNEHDISAAIRNDFRMKLRGRIERL